MVDIKALSLAGKGSLIVALKSRLRSLERIYVVKETFKAAPAEITIYVTSQPRLRIQRIYL